MDNIHLPHQNRTRNSHTNTYKRRIKSHKIRHAHTYTLLLEDPAPKKTSQRGAKYSREGAVVRSEGKGEYRSVSCTGGYSILGSGIDPEFKDTREEDSSPYIRPANLAEDKPSPDMTRKAPTHVTS